MNKDLTWYITIGGLTALSVVMPYWLYLNTATLGLIGCIILGAMFPLLLLRATWKRSRNWSGITALFMIFYAVLGIMDIVATLATPDSGMVIGVIGVVVFFTALDAGRRSG
ncbi:MAG: hypothetical protein ACR2QG_01160 [Gammaproteobacteria bacterium]